MKDFELKPHISEVWPLKWIIPLVICGYLTGIGLILLWYELQPAHKTRDLTQLSLLYVCLGLLCTTMLFCRAVRCVLTLALPSLGSSRGRALLITFAFFLAARGPIANILANLMVLLRSLACAQELLRQALGHMMDVIAEPVRAVHMAIELLMDELRRVMRQLMELLLRIQSYLLLIIDTFKSCAGWLKAVLELCNSELGTPWARCQKAASRAMLKCRARLGVLKSLCYATKLFLALCYPAKLVDVFCAGVWDGSWAIVDTILERYYEFVAHLEQMFDVSISFEHDFYFHTNASRNLSDVGEEIIHDIKVRLRPLVLFDSWLDLLCWIMVLFIFIKSIYFYLRYMHSLKYQNMYLTRSFYAIDAKCRQKGEPAVLPLQRLEHFKYLKLSSLRLTAIEYVLLAESASLMCNTCLQLGCICLVDFSVFWLLDMITYYGEEQKDIEIPPFLDVQVEGGGFVGDVMRGVANAFRPMSQKTRVDSKSCLPEPVEPAYRYYIGILVLCLLAWFILVAEPYLLRLRHAIMERYYPERAHERALYLHSKILAKRVSFLKMMRRKIRATLKYQKDGCCNCCWGWIRTKFCWCCRCLCRSGGPRKERCLLCAQLLSSSNRIQCDTPECPGLYCQPCYSESKHQCCLCKRPMDYGDHSDISEIHDSSDDPGTESYGQIRKRTYCAKYRKEEGKKKP
ncbi:DC-STAMP domain-containing protein 2-like [Drosophila hydei]|uniref:DC-STAMP domain-containing protein 2-like n=1 Tax=Drosophila hydei TaxID=7224 RepID=A0A6J2STC7_DROHY|nr:DC-STAMP domain-containing protein 2-like [Drosophila hydei]